MFQSNILIDPYYAHWGEDLVDEVENAVLPAVHLDSYGQDLSPEDIAAICHDLNSATCYLMDFLHDRADVDEDTALDAVEHYTRNHGLDMEYYTEVALSNIEYKFEL